MQQGEWIVEREIARWSANREAVERAARDSLPAPLITISRQLGSGGRELATTLGTRLRWPVYDHQLIDEMVRQSHASRQLVLDVDESVASRALLWLGAMVTQELFDYDDYRSLLLQILATLAERGSAIVLGHGANFAPRRHPRLDVRIIAPLESRIERLIRSDGMSRQQAVLAIRHSDQQRCDFTHRVYQGQWDDPSNYDLVINTGVLTVVEAAELTQDALKELMQVAGSQSEQLG